uniref:Uncharacterized protein n=1 Tax=Cacopsylla melanoneura TaxID=428564 RepID=A0A8D9F0V5_9HEMI
MTILYRYFGISIFWFRYLSIHRKKFKYRYRQARFFPRVGPCQAKRSKSYINDNNIPYPGWVSNPRHLDYKVDAVTTELPGDTLCYSRVLSIVCHSEIPGRIFQTVIF